MQIVPYQPAHLQSLYEGYRQLVAGVPHCRFIPSLNYFGHALAQAEQAGANLLIAEDSGGVRGVATLRPIAPAGAASSGRIVAAASRCSRPSGVSRRSWRRSISTSAGP